MSLLAGGVLLVVLLVWMLRPGAPRTDPGAEREPVDPRELEAAEREVQELDLQQRPEDGFDGDDWGPGASRPR